MLSTKPNLLSGHMYLFFFLLLLLFSCKQHNNDDHDHGFVATPQEFAVSDSKLTEASGMADSKTNPGYLWIHQDGGNPPDLHLMRHDGVVQKTIHLANIQNRDWEDIALSSGPKPDKQYLYIAETGDNLLVHADYAIYRIEEPSITIDTVQQIDKIAFFYPDGSHNAEAILVDAASKDIYIITKNDMRPKIFKLSWPYSTTTINKAQEAGSLPFSVVVSAAMLPGGHEIVIKTYDAIYYFPRNKGETIEQSLSKPPVILPYRHEPQGEAIAFAANNSGYYTLSEKALASSVKLCYYKRK